MIRREKELNLKATSWFSSFNPKQKILYRTLLGFGLQMFQQLTGANYFFYYGASIFQSVGIENSYVTQIILGVVNSVCTLPGLWFIERFGRRKPLIYGGLWQCAWLIVFGAVGSERDPNNRTVGAILILAACMFIAGYIYIPFHFLFVPFGSLADMPLFSTQICKHVGTRRLGSCGRDVHLASAIAFGLFRHRRKLELEFPPHVLHPVHYQ